MPRYRVLMDWTPIGPQLYSRGATVNFQGWPTFVLEGRIEAADRDAEKIVEYYRLRRLQVGFPDSPFDSEFGRFFLPTILPDVRGTRLLGWIPDGQADAAMPRYTVKYHQPMELVGRDVAAGDEFSFIGWPSAMFIPVNDPARRAVDYFAANGSHPKLPVCPWDEFTADLFLPALPVTS